MDQFKRINDSDLLFARIVCDKYTPSVGESGTRMIEMGWIPLNVEFNSLTAQTCLYFWRTKETRDTNRELGTGK